MEKREEMKNKVQVALSKNNYNDFWKDLIKLIENTPPDQRQEDLDILGQATITNPDLCEYIHEKFEKMLLKLFQAKEIIEMESYVIQTYVLYPSETILASGWGKLKQKNSKTEGRFYITPYRVIMSGPTVVKHSSVLVANINAVWNEVRAHKVQAIKDAVRSALAGDIETPRGTYGDSLLFVNHFDVHIGHEGHLGRPNLNFLVTWENNIMKKLIIQSK